MLPRGGLPIWERRGDVRACQRRSTLEPDIWHGYGPSACPCEAVTVAAHTLRRYRWQGVGGALLGAGTTDTEGIECSRIQEQLAPSFVSLGQTRRRCVTFSQTPRSGDARHGATRRRCDCGTGYRFSTPKTARGDRRSVSRPSVISLLLCEFRPLVPYTMNRRATIRTITPSGLMPPICLRRSCQSVRSDGVPTTRGEAPCGLRHLGHQHR